MSANGSNRSSRGIAATAATSPFPIVERLPGMLQGDPFTRAFTAGLDDVWAAALVALDNVHAYLDPRTAPQDFVVWLASWVGVVLDENWPEHRQRELVAKAVDLYRWRGTARGIRALVAVYAGVEPEIDDSGGVDWSLSPGEPAPGEPRAQVTIRLRVAEPERIDTERLGVLVADAVPAHVAYRIDVAAVP
jgi:phage tail-like protein